jgi:hypothetical protein
MEVQTEAIGRVLEALAPALGLELDRMISETRLALEADFLKRLETAVHEAEVAARAEALGDVQRLVEEARESARQQLTEELRSEFDRKIEDATGQLRATMMSDLEQAQSTWSAERAQLQDQLTSWRALAEAPQQLSDAASQFEILMRWLNLAEPFTGGLAIYTARDDGLALWRTRGKAVFPPVISQATTDPESYFKPVIVRGKTVAAICAARPYTTEALDQLVATLGRAVELFGLKIRASGPKTDTPEVNRSR